MQRSINACPDGPKTASPSSEYDVIYGPTFSLHAICIFIVYMFNMPQRLIPRAPPTMPTVCMAAGVAKIPIPMKHFNMLK